MNGNGSHSRTWQDVTLQGLTMAYRLVALYLLRDLINGQQQIADLILRAHTMTP